MENSVIKMHSCCCRITLLETKKILRRIRDMIRAKFNAAEILHWIFFRVEWIKSADDWICAERLLFKYAIQYNHVELAKLLCCESTKRLSIPFRLSSVYDVLNSSVPCRIRRPLFIAMRCENYTIIETLLRAGSIATSHTTNPHKLTMTEQDKTVAVKYAFELMNPKVLQLLVQHDWCLYG